MFKRSKFSSAFRNKTRHTGFSKGQLSFAPLEDRRLLATFTVTNVSDAPVAMAGDVPGSLRQAIFDANANAGADTISFGGLFDTEQTIQLVDQLTITDSVTVAGPGANLLTLDAGNGADNTPATGDGYRIFNIEDGNSNNQIDVTLSGLTLTGGDTANGVDGLDGTDGFNATNGSDGGAIRSLENLTLIASTVTGNATGNGGNGGNGTYGNGGDGGDGGDGGGIYSGNGVLTLIGSTISSNIAGDGGSGGGGNGGGNGNGNGNGNGGRGGSGGGIYSGDGALTINGSTISGNILGDGGSGGRYGGNYEYGYGYEYGVRYGGRYGGDGGDGGDGGGIYSGDGALTITGSTISGNTTAFGGDGGLGSMIALEDFGNYSSGSGRGGDGGSGGGVYISHGTLTVAGSTITGNTTRSGGENGSYSGLSGYGGNGGGIGTFSGAVSLTNSTVSGNTVNTTRSVAGGGISTFSGAVSLTNSTVNGNSANGINSRTSVTVRGGGIHSTSGAVSLINSTVSGNNAATDATFDAQFGRNSSSGGGISTSSGAVSVTNSTVSDNNATASSSVAGGGINSNFGTVHLTNSIVSGNNATGDSPLDTYGGGINTGSAIFSNTGSTVVSLENSTVSGNSSSGFGGGIHTFSGAVNLASSTVIDNQAVQAGGGVFGNSSGGVSGNSSFSTNLTIENSIVAGNTDSGFGPDLDLLAQGVQGTLTINHSLIGVADTITQTIAGNVGNQTGTAASPLNPLLGPLANNGGPTQTHALLPGSPAIGTGSNALAVDADGLPLLTDQRGTGFDRIKAGTIDIGAFESDFAGPSLIVDTNSDLVDPLDGFTSLREAISFANLRPGNDTITFTASAFTGGAASLIRLTSGELIISDELTIDGSMASDLTITGDANGNDITDSGNITDVDASGESLLSDNSRVINFTRTTGDLTLQGVTVTGGRTTEDNFNFPSSTHSGGGIRFPSNGTLRLVNSTVSGNSTAGQRADGGGVFANSGDVVLEDSNVSGNRTEQFLSRGGGIFGYSGDLSLLNSFVTGNSTAGEAGYGGGIFSISGNLTIAASDISANSTTGTNADGGGIFSVSGNVSLTSSTVSGNSTAGTLSHGGGIFSTSGPVILFNSTVSNNSISGQEVFGGGIRTGTGDVSLFGSTVSGNVAEGETALGGGIETYAGNINLTNSTISGNRAGGPNGQGGGLWVNNSTVQIINSTITGNVATGEGGGFSIFQSDIDRVLTIRNSIIAGNTDNGTAPDFEAPDNPNINLVVSHSLIGNNTSTTLAATGTGSPDSNGNLVGSSIALLSPLLGPLADNGGPTLTHALLPGSPAINAGDPTAVAGSGDTPLLDQNGQSRVQEGRLDIGASEFGAAGPAVLRGDVNQDDAVNFLDISPFISALSNSTFQAEADVNQDGVVNFLDISPFIGVLSSPGTSQLSFANLTAASSDLSQQTNDTTGVKVDATPSAPTLLRQDVASAQLSVSAPEPALLVDTGGSHVQDGGDSLILQTEILVEAAQPLSVPLPPSMNDRFAQQVAPDLSSRASFVYQPIRFQATSDLSTPTVPLSVGDYRASILADGVADNNNGQNLLQNYSRKFYLAFAGDVNLDGTVDVVNDVLVTRGNLGAPEDASWRDSDFSNDGHTDALGVHSAIDTLESSAAIDEAFAQLEL